MLRLLNKVKIAWKAQHPGSKKIRGNIANSEKINQLRTPDFDQTPIFFYLFYTVITARRSKSITNPVQTDIIVMAIEIERKFLVLSGDFKNESLKSTRILQGYLSSQPGRTVRVRIRGEKGYITVKGISNDSGTSRFEWEKEIPASEAVDLLKICEPGLIEKTRYEIVYGMHIFEVDEFYGDNLGLVVAEVELVSEEEQFAKPEWIGREVTGEAKYYNSMLRKTPYSKW